MTQRGARWSAQQRGDKFYTPESPCRNGHASRYTSDGACVQCTLKPRRGAIERFRALCGPADERGCVPWLGGSHGSFGHGTFWDGKKPEKAHRFIYAHHNGPIATGMVIRHACDNPACVNIDHLIIGTQGDNVADRQSRLRTARGRKIALSKLSDSDAAYIRDVEGVSVGMLASYFGVATSTISRIRSRQMWAHIP